MADDSTTTETTEAEQSAVVPSAVTQNTGSTTDAMIPKSRFDEVNNKLKTLEREALTREAAQKEADDKKLAAAQEWQKLADKRAETVAELKPKAELADKLSEMVLAQYQAEIKEWPAEVKAMQPSEDASILEKLDWMNKAKPLALAMLADKPVQAGNGRRPQPVAASARPEQPPQRRESDNIYQPF